MTHGQKHNEKMCWIARVAVKKSAGLREALLTNHKGDVPNGYAQRARNQPATPLPEAMVPSDASQF
jgi:hypothetical protein